VAERNTDPHCTTLLTFCLPNMVLYAQSAWVYPTGDVHKTASVPLPMTVMLENPTSAGFSPLRHEGSK
jgi:hypothetical protein